MTAKHPPITILVGSGRSGTTYLAKQLTEHMDIGMYNMGEPKFIIPLYRKLKQYGDLNKDENLWRLVTDVHGSLPFRNLRRIHKVETHAHEIMERVENRTYSSVVYAALRLIADKLGKSRLGYKDPIDANHLATLAQIFPNARFVHVVRDGRDVASSVLNYQWGPNNIYTGALDWKKSTDAARRDGALLGDRYFETRFEDLLTDTDTVVPQLGAFINRGQNMEQIDRLLQAINENKRLDRLYGWKHTLTLEQRRVFEAVAGDTLQACGYEREFDNIKINPAQAAYYRGQDFASRVKNRLNRNLEPET